MPFEIGQSLARQPRGLVKLNDTEIAGWTRFEVSNNVFTAADTFRVEFVISGLPPDRDKAWFSQQKDMYVELFAGFPDDLDSYGATDLKSLIYGQADLIEFHLERGIIEVTGRDLTRVFIDTKTTEKWPNLTASQIAEKLAASHGLAAAVTQTTEKAGKFYQLDYVSMADERTEWDILCYLAQSSGTAGFRVYVRGKTLYFEPKPDESTLTPYAVEWEDGEDGGPPSANVIEPVFTRALTVSRGIQVVVRSWNARQGKAFNATYPSSKTVSIRPGQSSSKAQVFRYTRPGLTQERASRLAQQYYEQLIQHEMTISFESPADNDLDVTNLIEVRGTGTAFDQRYYPDSIDRTMDFDGGYSMRVHAKNHEADSEASA